MKAEKLGEVKDVGEEQYAVSKSEAEAKEGVRGRKVNTNTAAESQEKKNTPRGRLKQAVTTKEEMVTTMGVDDDNKSPEETEEGMVDVQIVLATLDRGTNEAINNKEGTKENGGNICHQCVPCMKKWYPKMTEEIFTGCCPVCQGNCNCTHCLRNVCPKSCIKVALDFLSPENVGECIRLTEDFRLLPHNHKAKEDNLRVKKVALHAVEAAIKDLEKFVPKSRNSQFLENSKDHPNHQYYENSQVFSTLYEVPITENLHTSQNTEKDVRLQIDHDDITCSNPEYEVGSEGSGGIIKRSRTSEEGDYIPHSNPETPNSGVSTVHLATCKHKSCSSLDKFVAEFHEMRVIRENEVKVMNKRLDFEEKRELKKEEWKTKKMYYMHLNTLFAKDHLLPEDEDMKHHLLAMLYGK